MLFLFDVVLSLGTADKISIFFNDGETGNDQPPARQQTNSQSSLTGAVGGFYLYFFQKMFSLVFVPLGKHDS